MLLDDVFSQLDIHTRKRIMQRLFAPTGLLRRWGTTVVLATSSGRLNPTPARSSVTTDLMAAKYHSCADKIMLLDDEGGISFQGPSDEFNRMNDDDQDDALIEPAVSDLNDELYPVIYEPEKSPPEEVRGQEGNRKAKESTRQSGDFSVYRYYFKSLDWRIAVAFLVLQISLAFLSSFPCMFCSVLARHCSDC